MLNVENLDVKSLLSRIGDEFDLNTPAEHPDRHKIHHHIMRLQEYALRYGLINDWIRK